MPNFSSLARLEVPEKLLWVGGGWVGWGLQSHFHVKPNRCVEVRFWFWQLFCKHSLKVPAQAKLAEKCCHLTGILWPINEIAVSDWSKQWTGSCRFASLTFCTVSELGKPSRCMQHDWPSRVEGLNQGSWAILKLLVYKNKVLLESLKLGVWRPNFAKRWSIKAKIRLTWLISIVSKPIKVIVVGLFKTS